MGKIMKIIVRIAGVALMALASTAAQANGESRVEVRGGVATGSLGGRSATEGIVGVGVGYDFDISNSSAFIGIEGGADQVLVQGEDITWSAGARVGAKVGDSTRLFLTGGYGFFEGESSPYLGVGAQEKLGGNFYGKIEYRRSLGDFINVDYIVAGFGLSF